MKKFILMLIAMVAIVANVNAQVMIVILNNGTQVEYMTNEIDHIEFSEKMGTGFSIVGTWQANYVVNDPEYHPYEEVDIYTFNPDGNYTCEVKRDREDRGSDYGRYSYENNILTLNEYSEFEGYASYTILVEVVSSKEWKVTMSEEDIEEGYPPTITFKKI